MLKKSLDWDVYTAPVAVNNILQPMYKGIVRDDTEKVLKIFTKNYYPFKNEDFTTLTENIAVTSGGIVKGYDEMRGGKIVLSYVEHVASEGLVEGSEISDKIVIINSFDGSNNLKVGITTKLLSCENQFSQILFPISMRHNKTLTNMAFKKVLEKFLIGRAQLYKSFERMNTVQIDEEIVLALTQRLFEIENFEECSPSKLKRVADFRESVECEMQRLGNTHWGLFNGVTHYTTHKLRSATVEGNVIGHAARLNNIAYDTLL